MNSNFLHIYSAYLNKGGANIAADSLFNGIKNSNDIKFVSRSSFYESSKSKYKANFMRVIGKVIGLPTYQNTCYLPYCEFIDKQNSSNYELVHSHWLNNIPLNSIPDCNNLIITAHDQWIINNCWAWDPDSLSSPTNSLEKLISKTLKKFIPIKSPVKYIKDHYPLRKIITPSKWLKNYIINNSDLHASDIKVIHNLIDNNSFRYLEENNFLNEPRDNLFSIVTSCAYWSEWRKGKCLLFDLLKRLIYAFDGKVKFKKLGDIKLDRELMKYSDCFGKIKNKNQISKIYNNSDCMLLPSRLENLTQTLCEAQLCGLPAVAFNVGGNNEIINDKFFGYCVDYPNLDDFVNAIKAIQIDETIEKRKQRALKAKTKFNNKKIIDQHLNLYKQYCFN